MSDVGDLVEVILASVIIYFLDFTVGSHFVALIGIFPYVVISRNGIRKNRVKHKRAGRNI